MPDSLQPHRLQHARLPCPSLSRSLFKVKSIELVMLPTISSSATLLFPLPSIFPSTWVFSSESPLCIRGPKYRSFGFHVSPSNEYSELISFRIDWFELLAVSGTLQDSSPTPQFESSSSLVLSLLPDPTLTSIHGYWKTIALTKWTRM